MTAKERMTAKESGSRGTEVRCLWFSGENLKNALFPIECLEPSIAPIKLSPAQVREALADCPLLVGLPDPVVVVPGAEETAK